MRFGPGRAPRDSSRTDGITARREFERRLTELRETGVIPDLRAAQIERLKAPPQGEGSGAQTGSGVAAQQVSGQTLVDAVVQVGARVGRSAGRQVCSVGDVVPPDRW